MSGPRTASSLIAIIGCAWVSGIAGCTVDGVAILPGQAEGAESETEGSGGEGTGISNDDTADSGDSAGDGAAPDLPEGGTESHEACGLVDAGIDAPLPCDLPPVSLSLDPVITWTWTGPNGEDSVIATPLVANLDDDDGNGVTDLCDKPELVVLAVDLPANKIDPLPAGHLYVLDTATGETEFVIDHPLDATATPALADLDGDGVVELLAFERSEEVLGQPGERRVVAFEADGSLLWTSETWVWSEGGGGLAIADLDADGSPELLAPEHVLHADGTLWWAPQDPPMSDSLPAAADLDLDGTLEVLFGRSVYAADGTELFELAVPGNKNTGVVAVANFDDDEYPEIYIQSFTHRVFEHDGEPKANCGVGGGNKGLPVAIADTNGDGRAEVLTKQGPWYRAKTLDGNSCQTLWSVKIADAPASAGTAFDFLADGGAEAIYADREWVRIFDSQGFALAEFERDARPSMANPIVADADNDGAAELIIAASEPEDGDDDLGARVSIIYVENADDRFAPTRRIWNQHAYHATNIREDATVPAEQSPHWQQAQSNSFRTNTAPSFSGSLCQPPAFD
ncbi:FG-GAP repeat protein [Enhygromyxa salina]|uniref:FG-GAP repeat protein n=1 Tax=Enhygromyxa salina TaxID=215803 RepID=A0A2S9XX97_9BACT|nr:VCBS repeat-containing protein [Enhygromyxa salina]PRP97486.1 FG-GAP repeat protein [Enhygromyxa salina]